MNRLKLLGAVALLGVLACEEATPPPPVGSIVGQVAIEGTGVDGVSVNLSNGNSTTTSGGGNYRFDNVEGGAYTVTISGYPSDATFDATSAAATISTAGQSVTVNFSGAYIRTASVMGSVTVENMGLGGVTVALSGVSSATAVTDDNGQYAFTGLRMGSYSVEISGFDSDEVGFSNTASAVTVGVGESKIVSFDGTYLRTAGIQGRVSVEGAGLEGVNVSLSGGPDGVSETTTTDASGQYSFARLRAGDYAVGISGYDMDDYEFEVTSQNVTVALGETANVPFEGVLLRTSGVSGRVSVEGIGLADVMVTLSGMDMEDMTAMTDAGGLYAFAGLAAGDYTVAIALSDEQMAAYVFEMTSMDVTVGDDETQIVNFEAEHAATASVTVQLFIDELMKNDMHDEGEMTFPTAQMLAMVAELGLPLALPISLAGPGVHDMQSGTPMPDGSVVFSGLKAGQYQVIVSDIPAEVLAALPPALGAVLRDYAYGGPATGYPIALGVGESAMQHAPIDITHTTVHFGVTLKAGEMRGMPLPGAMVTLYSDAMGETKVGEGMTMVNEETMHAVASIRIARAGTTGHMVHAGVAADSAYTVADGMTAVMWDPQSTYTMGANDNDIVNLNVDVTYGGATITTEYGGGEELAGWAVSVAHGDTMYADVLDDDGMAAFSMTVGADDLPAMYTFSVDTIQDNELDGGESFEGTDVEYVHTGLSLAGTMDAGTIEVNYTTQTLKVYVHHERDQVMGYTGNVLGGDERASGFIDVGIRYIADNGRSREFARDEWRATSSTFSDRLGVVTFRGVPADAKVIAVAEEAAQDPEDEDYQPIMLLDPDELAAYTDEDGATGGMFGDHGGFHHTVELCPLQSVDPTGQDHGECGSFAFVETYEVHGQAWKNDVIMNPADDGFTTRGLRAVPGTTVDLDPVEGKNLAGESESFTALEKPVRTRGENVAGTSILDETKQFDFGRMAAGVYKVTVPKGWVARNGTPDDAAGLASATFNPLAGDAQIDVTPTTGILYGRVMGSDGFPLDSTTVDVNGLSTETDEFGRYIVDGFAHRTGANTTRTNPDWRRMRIVVVTASRGGFDMKADTMLFNPTVNTPTEHDVNLAGTAATATVSGTVTAFGSNDPIAGVEIRVDGDPPINKNAKSVRTLPANDIYVTGADGTYTISVPAKGAGMTSRISAHRAGMTFSPAHLDLSTPKGSSVSGINFSGVANSVIAGRVRAPGGGPLSGVMVKAIANGDTEATDSMSTGATGTFSLSVPAGVYEVDASKGGYEFTCPGDPASCRVTVGLGQTVSFGDFMSEAVSNVATLSALSLADGMDDIALDPAFASGVTDYAANIAHGTEQVTVTATATDENAMVDIMPADADDQTDGHQVDLAIGDTEITATVMSQDGTDTTVYTVTATRSDGTDATLSALSLSEGTLDPAFSSTVDAYTSDVGVDVDEVTVTATATDADAEVDIMPADADDEAAGHQVELGAAGSDTEITVTVTAADGTTTEDYTVTVSRSDGHQAPSAPTNLEVAPGDQQAVLTWGAPRQIGSSAITAYAWEASAPGYLTVGSGATNLAADATTVTATGLTNGVTYTFSVWAINQKGDPAVDVPGTKATAEAKAQPSITLGGVNGNTITEAQTDTLTATVALSNASTEDITVMVAEVVDDDNGAQVMIANASIMIPAGSTTPVANTDPTTIVAINDDVDDDAVGARVVATSTGATTSDTASVTITDNDEVPGAPGALVFSSVGAAGFTVEWTSPAAPGTSDITHYQIRYSDETLDADDEWMMVEGGAGARTHPVSGLDAETTYNVEVRAVSAAGDGTAVTGSQATTAASG